MFPFVLLVAIPGADWQISSSHPFQYETPMPAILVG
jgi:hypothetical protein